jgi:PAS domain S-box-containing protein
METLSSGAYNTLKHELQERIKEFDCIYAICDMVANPNAPFDEIIQNIADTVPLGFLSPEATCACVTIFNQLIKSANFKPCPWKIEASIIVNEKIAGKLESGYLGALVDEGSPFLEEEKKLLQVIANRIGMIIQGKTLKDSFDKSEKRYRDLVENAPIGIARANFRGDLLYANNACLRMFGFESLEEAMSLAYFSRYRNPGDRKTMMEILKKTGKLANVEAECITKAGESIFILFSATLKSNVITAMMMDITERKLADEALIKSEMRLIEVQRIAHVGSWDWDIVGGELRWSDEVYRIFGLKPQEFGATYKAFLARVHPEDRGSVEQAVKASLADPRKPYELEHRVIHPDGSERVVQQHGAIRCDTDGKPVRMIGSVLDVTEHIQTEMALTKAIKEINRYKERLEAENIYLRQEISAKPCLPTIVGQSDAIRYVQFRIQQVARTKMTVLLTGETGTGKGVFAAGLHEASDRKGKPFVHVNCAGLPPNLIESELFGREKGAFTGSSERQIGRFELANGGTIFLDEIGELPLELQAKLLKVIESGEFERLGSPRSVKVDVRIVACTNSNLENDVKMGRFRRDLFYRLNVFPITIPPLNERIDDIPLLVKFYMDKFSRAYNKQITILPEQTVKELQNCDWPGNVRELINVVERAVILSDGPTLQLAEKIVLLPTLANRKRALSEEKGRKGLAEMERVHILRTLMETGWKIEGPAGAAASLRMNPSTLRALMKRLGIKRPRAH